MLFRSVENGKATLLNENGGKKCFGHSWAMRFWKRHALERDQVKASATAGIVIMKKRNDEYCETHDGCNELREQKRN